MKKLLLAAGLAFAVLAPTTFAQKAETPPKAAASATPKAAVPATPKAAAPATPQAELLDINTASEQELAALKGIGEVRAKAIVKGRPYKGKDELVQKKIVPKSVYNDIKEQIIARQDTGARKAEAKPADAKKK